MSLKAFVSAAKRLEQAITKNKDQDPLYQEYLERLYLQHGLRQTLQLYFNKFRELISIIHFMSVKAIDDPWEARGVAPPMKEPESIFPLLTTMGLATALSLEYRGNNSNPVLLGWYRSGLSRLIRTMLENDNVRQYRMVASSGGRKFQAHPLAGGVFGQGKEQTDVVLVGPEMDQALINPHKKGALIAMAFGPKGAFRPLPDTSFMFKIVAGKHLDKMNLGKILADCRKDEAVDEEKLVRGLLKACRHKGVKKPQIEILFRRRHRVLINTFMQKMQIDVTFDGLEEIMSASDGRYLFQGKNGSLLLSEGDDCLQGGVALGKPGGPDLIVGIDGAPQTLMSAILARLGNGKVAAMFLPLDQQHFTL